MRIVLQRVTEASVEVDGDTVGRIGPGFLALVGIQDGDTEPVARAMAAKTIGLRVFADETRPFHRSLEDIAGAVLVVSQFTLTADMRRGRRPGWRAASADVAEPLVAAYADALEADGVEVARGVFGAAMRVRLCNDGPVTLVLDSAEVLARGEP